MEGRLDKRRSLRWEAAVVGAAALAGVAAKPAEGGAQRTESVAASQLSEAQQTSAAPTEASRAPAKTTLIEKTSKSAEHSAWFSRKLGSIQTISRKDFAKLEKMVEENLVPLPLQINFFEKTLNEGGAYFRELHDEKLSLEKFSRILKLVNATSSLMTTAYEERKPIAGMEKHFDVAKLRDASRPIARKVATEPGKLEMSKYCNGFLGRSKGDVYYSTAAHCVKGTVDQEKFTYLKDGTETAVLYIHPSELKKWNVNDPAALPDLEKGISPATATGKVVASFSWGADGKERVHFSIGMPLPKIVRSSLYGANVDIKNPYLQKSMMFIKPHGEGEVVTRDHRGKILSVKGSGSSGEAIGAFDKAYVLFGNLAAIHPIEDSCLKVCYAVSYFTSPDAFRNVIEAERRQRLNGKTASR